MKRVFFPLVGLLLTLSCGNGLTQVTAAPQLMNFQGRLATPNGNPLPNGTYSIRFSLWDAVSAGTEKWNQTLSTVQVKNGTFAVLLNTNTAGLFNSNLYLEIKIGTDTALTPRQQLVTVPYAFKSDLAITVPDGSITGAKIAAGTITADKLASGVGGSGWSLTGNIGIDDLLNFLGTTDNKSLVFKVNNRQSMRYSYAANATYNSINVLGGSDINSISAGVIGATLAGGGQDFFTGTDYPNRVLANFGTVGGGRSNTASGDSSTIGGGYGNTASGNSATVAGGNFNIASGNNANVAGGYLNTASGDSATVAGGYTNVATGSYSFVAGRRAKANHQGAFVWGDSTDADFASTATNQFLIRAVGGVGINNANPAGNAFIIQNDSLSNITQTWYAPTKGTNQSHSHYGTNGDWYLRSAANAGKVVIQDNGGNVGIGTNNPQYTLDVSGEINSSSTISGHGSSNASGSIDTPGIYGDNVGGTGIHGETNSDVKVAIYGHNSGHQAGIGGASAFGFGVSGSSISGFAGVFGSSTNNGVFGLTSSSGGNTSGVYGRNDGAGWGVFGYSVSGFAGVFGSSANNGVYGQTANAAASGVYGRNDGSGVGMEGYSVGGTGVNGKTSAAGGYGGYFTNFAGGTALWVNGTARVSVLEITGGADLAEKFAVEGKIEPGMVVEIDAEHEGKLRLSQSAFNRRVAGVISGAKKLNAGVILSDPSEKSKDDLPVAMSGRVWVWCDASEQAVTPGDFLTTAARAGYAMPVSDLSKAQGAILGKAMTSLAKGKVGLVLALVNLQ